MSEVLALEFGNRGVRVNCVAPGPIQTPLVARLHSAEERRLWLGHVPQGRYGEPEEVAAAIAFLLSPEASYINGHTLAVDGGFLSTGILRGWRRIATATVGRYSISIQYGDGVKNPVLVEVLRGDIVESIHRGVVAVVDGDGKIVMEIGDIDGLCSRARLLRRSRRCR